jgi:hypothetical protein
MRPLAATALVALLYALHQDVWFWREARPLVFGVLPVGLFYHAAYTVVTAMTLWALARLIWPHHLEERRPGTARAAAPRPPGTGLPRDTE